MSEQFKKPGPLAASYEAMSREYQDSAHLRDAVYAAMEVELQDRITYNPDPSDEELRLGAYVEHLEPQVRDSIMILRAKGYNTASSGFSNPPCKFQCLDLNEPLSDGVVNLIRDHCLKLGVVFLIDNEKPEKGHWKLRFSRSFIFEPVAGNDLVAIKAKWDELAAVLPDLGSPAPMVSHSNADRFRKTLMHGKVRDYNWTLE